MQGEAGRLACNEEVVRIGVCDDREGCVQLRNQALGGEGWEGWSRGRERDMT
jgi:hypothetical protein